MPPRVLQYVQKRKTVVTAIFVIAVFLFIGLFLYSQPAFADTTGDTFGLQPVDENLPLGNQDIRVIIGKIIRAALGLLGVVALGIVLYGGFTIMTSQGNEEKVAEGRKILINGVIGLAIIMAAFTIVHFVITKLAEATGSGGGEDKLKKPVFETFSGSAGLGKVIKDHYPFRDEKGVKRNTKIVITFSEPVDVATIVENTNNTCWGANGQPTTCSEQNKIPYLGDCKPLAENFSFEVDCDQFKTDALQIFKSNEEQSQNKELVKGSVSVLYEDGEQKNPYTLVFRPHAYLGTEGELVRYMVVVTDNIKKKNGGKLFEKQTTNYYKWEFETDGELDLTAPIITDVNPALDTSVARNEYIQINFNEPVDPTMVQGSVNKTTEAAHIKFATTVQPNGEWKITNGYKTVEFHSEEQCGLNSCGEPLFCMPVTCEVGACDTQYGVLVKTASLVGTKTFESIPFSGVMDMAGNALDGNADGKPDGKPAGQSVIEQAKPDNYFWKFIVKNEIDRSAPYIEHIAPAIDKEQVADQEPVKIRFNRKMLFSSLYNPHVGLEEYPVSKAENGDIVEFWFKSDSKNETFSSNDVSYLKTVTKVLHRDFGPNGLDFYYFPIMTNGVRATNGNCLHPGRGPFGNKNTAPVCSYVVEQDGTVSSNANCVPVDTKNAQGGLDHENDTGCVIDKTQGFDSTRPDTKVCVDELKKPGVSPL